MVRDPTDLAAAQEEAQSAVSWAAVFAGAVAGLALSFVLLALAAGLGFSIASPWPLGGHSSETSTPFLGAGMIIVQVLSSGFGGYLAGRLRTRWANVHSHEVHFRDTAHGLLSWALSTVIGVVIATTYLAPVADNLSSSTSVSTAAAQPQATVVAGLAVPRSADPTATQAQTERAASVAAQLSLFMGVGLLLSAFTASVCAALGGLRREEMHQRYWSERANSKAAG
jgi:hypothetical protein